MSKVRIGILGATGMVGQTLVSLLEGHPWFEVTALAASDKSVGKKYEEVMENRWSLGGGIPEYARGMKLEECKPGLDCSLVLSGLDSGVALKIEEDFARAGYGVSSNAKSHRMDKDVPLLMPEINPGHLGLIGAQRKRRGWKGFIVTDPNCTTMGMSLALKPLDDRFGVDKVMVTTMQALSGAGYPGVPSIDIVDNIIPYINDEEDKVEEEPLKILGELKGSSIMKAKMRISASCNRVAVKYGHTECISVKLSKKTDIDGLVDAFERFRPLKGVGLPSAPERPVIVLRQDNRPQPKLDVNLEKGMASVIGRIRRCNILDYKFVLLSHNMVRGAAGAAILNAELLKAKGYLDN